MKRHSKNSTMINQKLSTLEKAKLILNSAIWEALLYSFLLQTTIDNQKNITEKRLNFIAFIALSGQCVKETIALLL